MVLVAESRHLRKSDVLFHPLRPLPWALANGDGTMRKTNKAALARELERQVLPAAEAIAEPSATIIDDMSLTRHSLNVQTLHEGVRSHGIDVVFDTHREDSIKIIDRSNRGRTTGIQLLNMAPGHRIQQRRKFLSSSANKANHITVLVAEWKTPKLRDTQLYTDKYLWRKPACTSPRISGLRLKACSQTKKRLVQE